MTPATTFQWTKALNNWMLAKVDVNGVILPILKKGRTIAVPASFLAVSLGLRANRFTLGTYAERMKGKLVDIQVGSGIGNYRQGVAKCIYLSQIHSAMTACNVPVKSNQNYKVVASLLEAARDYQIEEAPQEERKLSTWVTGDEAEKAWRRTLDVLRRANVPTASLLAASANGWAYSKQAGVMNVMATSTTVRLTQDREASLNAALTEVFGCQMRAVLYCGRLGVGHLEHLGPEKATEDYTDLPFMGPDPEPTEEELDQAVEDATDRDLINALGSLAAGIDKRVEELAEDLDALEKKLDKYALLTARRNLMLSQILAGLAEVMGANLCTPGESSQGTWRGRDD